MAIMWSKHYLKNVMMNTRAWFMLKFMKIQLFILNYYLTNMVINIEKFKFLIFFYIYLKPL